MLSRRKSALLAESLVTNLTCCALKLLAFSHLHATVLPIQVLATTAAELRELLKQGGLAAGKLRAFRDEHLDILLNKGFSTPDMLATADEAMLTEPPSLPPALRRALVAQFNPAAAPTASTGGSCSICCAQCHMLGGNTGHGCVMGLGRWAAAYELAHIVGRFSGTHTHLFLAGQHGPM